MMNCFRSSNVRRLAFVVLSGITLCSAVAATTPTVTLTPRFSKVVKTSNVYERANYFEIISLLDSTGKPQVGVTVCIGYRPARTSLPFTYGGAAKTDTNGDAMFSVGPLPVGDYQFQAYAPGTSIKTVFWTVTAK